MQMHGPHPSAFLWNEVLMNDSLENLQKERLTYEVFFREIEHSKLLPNKPCPS